MTGPGSAVLLVVSVLALVAVVVLLVVLARARGGAARAALLDREVQGLRRRYEALQGEAGAAVVVHSLDGRVLEVGDRASTVLGVPRDALVGRPVAEMPVRFTDDSGHALHPAVLFGRQGATGTRSPGPVTVTIGRGGHEAHDRTGADAGAGAGAGGAAGTGAAGGGESRRVRVHTRLLPATPDSGDVLLTTFVDLGDHAALGMSGADAAALRAAMPAVPVALALADVDGRVREANQPFADLLGATTGALAGYDLVRVEGGGGIRADGPGSDGRGGAAGSALAAQVARLVAGARNRISVETALPRPDGRTVWAVLDIGLARAEDGAGPQGLVVAARDISAYREQSEALSHRARHDPLTGLANRALLQEVLQQALDQPGGGERVAVLACDLDGFKPINDRFGHAAGDDVLVHVAGVLRAAAGGRGTVARLGGDEFVVVLHSVESPRAVLEVAGAIHAGLREPVRLHRQPVQVRASVGVAVGSPDTLTRGAPGLLAAADAALYRAKAAGKSRTEVYEPSMGTDGVPAGLTAELTGAVDRGEMVLHLQPVVDLTDRRVVGHAALQRWQHPVRGLLLPEVFAAPAEEAGLGPVLARHAVVTAVAHLAAAPAQEWLGLELAALQLGDGELVAAVVDELTRSGVAPGRLVVRLTGASGPEASARIRRDLTALRDAGVPILLDRFGSEASSLALLRDLPVQGVALDASFTSGVLDDVAAARVVRAVGALARELALVTVADGVDTDTQADALRDSGWRYGRGWLFGGPQPMGAAR